LLAGKTTRELFSSSIGGRKAWTDLWAAMGRVFSSSIGGRKKGIAVVVSSGDQFSSSIGGRKLKSLFAVFRAKPVQFLHRR